MNEQEINYTYDVKCRKCAKIAKMWFGSSVNTTKESFIAYVNEHSTFPITMQCGCDNGSFMFHDIVSYIITL